MRIKDGFVVEKVGGNYLAVAVGYDKESGLAEFTSEEMSHIAGILQRQQGPVNEQALQDCIRTIQDEHQSGKVTTDEDLRLRQERMKQRKGIKA